MMNPDHAIAISETLNILMELKGEFAWSICTSVNNILMINFGNPHLTVSGPYKHDTTSSQAVLDVAQRRHVVPQGKWHLFVNCDWSVTTNFYNCNSFDTDILNITKTLKQLDGQKLTNVKQADSGNGWIFEFDLGGILQLVSPPNWKDNVEPDEDQWTIFYENGNCISYTNARYLQRSHV